MGVLVLGDRSQKSVALTVDGGALPVVDGLGALPVTPVTGGADAATVPETSNTQEALPGSLVGTVTLAVGVPTLIVGIVTVKVVAAGSRLVDSGCVTVNPACAVTVPIVVLCCRCW